MITGETPVQAQAVGLCGTLEVPEDPSNPDGRKLGLRVAVVPAVAAVPEADPLFAVAGGPGDASTEFFAWLPGHYGRIHATRDIVLVDQRGTGGSNRIELRAMPETTGLSAEEADARLATWMDRALTELDVDPRFYTSTVAADDLDRVRAALGYDKIDLYGTSYGGTLVQYYLRQHGGHVRLAVLDGSTPLDIPVLERMAGNSERALDLLLERCARDEACARAFPHLDTEWSTFRGRLEAGLTVTNPQTGETVGLDLLTAGPSLHNALRTGAAAAKLPLAIHLAVEERWDQVGALVPAPSPGRLLLMSEAILCSEAWAAFDPEEVARDGAGSYALPMQLAGAETQAALCRSVPKGVVPADDGSPVRTSVSTLWLTADADPQDPPGNLTGIPAQQPNSRILVMPAQEHVVGHLGCGPDIIAATIEAGSAAGVDASCFTGAAMPEFALP